MWKWYESWYLCSITTASSFYTENIALKVLHSESMHDGRLNIKQYHDGSIRSLAADMYALDALTLTNKMADRSILQWILAVEIWNMRNAGISM